MTQTREDLPELVEVFASAPAGCSFLQNMALAGVSPQEAATPIVSWYLVVRAMSEVSVWWGEHDQIVDDRLKAGPGLRPLAEAVLALPEVNWWFRPLDRDRQVWFPNTWGVASVVPPVIPSGPPSYDELEAQRPTWGTYSSTDYDGISSYAVGAHTRYDGLGELKLPFARHKLSVPANARVFEIERPQDWHRLCTQYPADELGSYDHNLLSPDYRLVAQDWDAVHVSLFGLLASEQVVVESPKGRTALTGWYAEMTAWLRWVFDGVERLPDLTEMPPVPEKLR